LPLANRPTERAALIVRKVFLERLSADAELALLSAANGKNQGHAGGKVRADDPERARVQRAAELRLDSSEASLDFSDITTR